MTIHPRPDLEAIPRAQVAEGHFASVGAALEAAVRGLLLKDIDPDQNLAWAKPYRAEADQAIAEGRTHADKDTFAKLEQRYGKL